MAKHPGYLEHQSLFVMYTYGENNEIYNRIALYHDIRTTMEFDRTILDNIPGSPIHNGGQIALGPVGMLHICNGDTWQSEIA